MRNAIMSTLAALLAAAGVLSATAQASRGTWTLDERGRPRLQMKLSWDSTHWSTLVTRDELVGLSEGQIASPASTPVAFRIEREAGVFHLAGAFQAGRGAGEFRFEPDRGFASSLGSLGVAGPLTDDDLMQLALAGVTTRYVSGMADAGLPRLTPAELLTLASVGVTPAYVAQMRALGLERLSADQAMRLKSVGVDAEYVERMRASGMVPMEAEALVRLRSTGVGTAAAGAPRERVRTRSAGTTREVVRTRVTAPRPEGP